MNKLDQIKKELGEITQGEWRLEDHEYPSFKKITGPSFRLSIVMMAIDISIQQSFQREKDATFIANAPSHVRWLIGEVERYRTALEKLRTPDSNGLIATEALGDD